MEREDWYKPVGSALSSVTKSCTKKIKDFLFLLKEWYIKTSYTKLETNVVVRFLFLFKGNKVLLRRGTDSCGRKGLKKELPRFSLLIRVVRGSLLWLVSIKRGVQSFRADYGKDQC